MRCECNLHGLLCIPSEACSHHCPVLCHSRTCSTVRSSGSPTEALFLSSSHTAKWTPGSAQAKALHIHHAKLPHSSADFYPTTHHVHPQPHRRPSSQAPTAARWPAAAAGAGPPDPRPFRDGFPVCHDRCVSALSGALLWYLQQQAEMDPR